MSYQEITFEAQAATLNRLAGEQYAAAKEAAANQDLCGELQALQYAERIGDAQLNLMKRVGAVSLGGVTFKELE